jgi:Na+/H+ antiporter NhaD/arsenite permease-like protein
MGDWKRRAAAVALLAWPVLGRAADFAFAGPTIGGIPVEFLFFGATLIGVALFHHHTMPIAVGGAALIAVYKIAVSPFRTGAGVGGFLAHFVHEWVVLSNLFLLLLGFGLLARYFEESRVPAVLPRYLPDDWKGGFALLALVFVLSSFLDNIAAAMIGGAIAATVFRGKVHVGYLAGIVAAANAGGAGSVVGDTTTTMMWISGISPTEVFEAYIGAIVALLIFGVAAARQQHALQPIAKEAEAGIRIDWWSLVIVAFILIAAIGVNVMVNVFWNDIADSFPFIGTAVWLAIFIGGHVRRPDWRLVPASLKGTVFLLALVLAASMMPVERLPPASWQTSFGLGFVSAVFDNIPLTALAIKQGGYDWGFLAYAVGFGGSMIWFGSSAGVALSNMYSQARSVGQWLRHGWHVAIAYVAGFLAMLAVIGFHPGATPKASVPAPPAQQQQTR